MKFATNPLPGMNPWLEAQWGDIHTKLTTYACDRIQSQLPSDLQARVEEYLSVYEPDEEDGFSKRRQVAPDIQIIEQPGVAAVSSLNSGTLLADEALHIRRRREPETMRSISIVDLKNQRRVVTAIEFISLANKTGRANRQRYWTKQMELLEAEVNLVEIDLLRAGGWVLAVQRDLYPQRLVEPYRICVIRGENSELAEVYQASFRQPLPNIRVPLRPADNDVLLPLQELLDQAYVSGRYGNDLEYSVMPEPPLEPDDWKWINDYLHAKQ